MGYMGISTNMSCWWCLSMDESWLLPSFCLHNVPTWWCWFLARDMHDVAFTWVKLHLIFSLPGCANLPRSSWRALELDGEEMFLYNRQSIQWIYSLGVDDNWSFKSLIYRRTAEVVRWSPVGFQSRQLLLVRSVLQEWPFVSSHLVVDTVESELI